MTWKSALSRQFGAAIEMLDNAVSTCPDALWNDRAATPEFWYVAFHALFFLDFYLADSPAGFAPPEPFTLAELDPEVFCRRPGTGRRRSESISGTDAKNAGRRSRRFRRRDPGSPAASSVAT